MQYDQEDQKCVEIMLPVENTQRLMNLVRVDSLISNHRIQTITIPSTHHILIMLPMFSKLRCKWYEIQKLHRKNTFC